MQGCCRLVIPAQKGQWAPRICRSIGALCATAFWYFCTSQLTSGEVFSGLPKRIFKGTSSGKDACINCMSWSMSCSYKRLIKCSSTHHVVLTPCRGGRRAGGSFTLKSAISPTQRGLPRRITTKPSDKRNMQHMCGPALPSDGRALVRNVSGRRWVPCCTSAVCSDRVCSTS